MSSRWITSEYSRQLAIAELSERFPGEHCEILEAFDILRFAEIRECKAALITHDGIPEIVIFDEVVMHERPALERVIEQIALYHDAASTTASIVERYRKMGGLEGPDLAAAQARQRDKMLAHIGEELADFEIPEDMRWNSDDVPEGDE